jgi:hypothetical protein
MPPRTPDVAVMETSAERAGELPGGFGIDQ